MIPYEVGVLVDKTAPDGVQTPPPQGEHIAYAVVLLTLAEARSLGGHLLDAVDIEVMPPVREVTRG